MCIIDGAPQVTDLDRSSIVAADIIVIPVQPSAFDIRATEEIVDLIAEANQLKNIQSCFVLNRVTKR
ncbi:AAA domain-containing protein, partial [Zymomonas mobilis]